MPEPYYQQDGITIYHGDCRDVLPSLGRVELVVTDPPYGINYPAGESTQRGIQKFERIQGDATAFDPSHILEVAEDAILFGCNNYAHHLPIGVGQWYCWDKVCTNGMKVRIAECEYAWHKRGTKPRVFRHLWSGGYRASEAGQRSQHPTQKPVALLRWCIGLTKDKARVVDCYMGSGTTLVAAKRDNRQAIGIEIEERYCEIAANRLRQGVLDFGD